MPQSGIENRPSLRKLDNKLDNLTAISGLNKKEGNIKLATKFDMP